jgi:hypothetical protein
VIADSVPFDLLGIFWPNFLYGRVTKVVASLAGQTAGCGSKSPGAPCRVGGDGRIELGLLPSSLARPRLRLRVPKSHPAILVAPTPRCSLPTGTPKLKNPSPPEGEVGFLVEVTVGFAPTAFAICNRVPWATRARHRSEHHEQALKLLLGLRQVKRPVYRPKSSCAFGFGSARGGRRGGGVRGARRGRRQGLGSRGKRGGYVCRQARAAG